MGEGGVEVEERGGGGGVEDQTRRNSGRKDEVKTGIVLYVVMGKV